MAPIGPFGALCLRQAAARASGPQGGALPLHGDSWLWHPADEQVMAGLTIFIEHLANKIVDAADLPNVLCGGIIAVCVAHY